LGPQEEIRHLALRDHVQMRLLVPGGDSLEQSQKLFLFMRRILGLHHQPKAVEVPGVSGAPPLREHILEPGIGKTLHRFGGHNDEQSAADADFVVGGTAFDGSTAGLDLNPPENLIRAIAPQHLTDEPGDYWNINSSFSCHAIITHSSGALSPGSRQT